MILLNIVVFLLILILGIVINNIAGKKLGSKDKKTLNQLFFYHTIIALTYYAYTVDKGVDSYTYWTYAKKIKIEKILDIFQFDLGTNTVFLLNYIPSNLLGMSYFQGTLLYSLLGYLGIIFLYLSIKKIVPFSAKIKGIKLFPLLLFLPNFHFWSSGVGKDTIFFLIINITIYCLAYKKSLIYIFIALFFGYILRPHMVFFLIFSFMIAVFLDAKIKTIKKIMILIGFMLIIALLFNKITSYLNIESFNYDSIEKFTNTKSEKLSGKNIGSSVNLKESFVIVRFFTFLFRPIFYDATNAFGLIVSLENLILLIITIKMFFSKPFQCLKKASFLIKGLFVFFLLSSVIFSLILGNLGIMIRMKNMIMPSFFIFLLWIFSKNEEIKTIYYSQKRTK